MNRAGANLYLQELIKYLRNAAYRAEVEREFKRIESEFGQLEQAHIVAKKLVNVHLCVF